MDVLFYVYIYLSAVVREWLSLSLFLCHSFTLTLTAALALLDILLGFFCRTPLFHFLSECFLDWNQCFSSTLYCEQGEDGMRSGGGDNGAAGLWLFREIPRLPQILLISMRLLTFHNIPPTGWIHSPTPHRLAINYTIWLIISFFQWESQEFWILFHGFLNFTNYSNNLSEILHNSFD